MGKVSPKGENEVFYIACDFHIYDSLAKSLYSYYDYELSAK